MKQSTNKNNIAEDATSRLVELSESLKGWNLISGLYSQPESHAEDVVHALAVEAREIVLLSIRLTFKLGEAGMAGREQRFQNLLNRLAELDEREAKLAAACRKALAEVKKDQAGKEGK